MVDSFRCQSGSSSVFKKFVIWSRLLRLLLSAIVPLFPGPGKGSLAAYMKCQIRKRNSECKALPAARPYRCLRCATFFRKATFPLMGSFQPKKFNPTKTRKLEHCWKKCEKFGCKSWAVRRLAPDKNGQPRKKPFVCVIYIKKVPRSYVNVRAGQDLGNAAYAPCRIVRRLTPCKPPPGYKFCVNCKKMYQKWALPLKVGTWATMARTNK